MIVFFGYDNSCVEKHVVGVCGGMNKEKGL